MESYIDRKIFLTKHDPKWIEAINQLKNFKNDDKNADFRIHYRKEKDRKDHSLDFNTVDHFEEDGKLYFMFMPTHESLLDIEVRDFDGQDYGFHGIITGQGELKPNIFK
jgi:hypothetical protein